MEAGNVGRRSSNRNELLQCVSSEHTQLPMGPLVTGHVCAKFQVGKKEQDVKGWKGDWPSLKYACDRDLAFNNV